MKSKQIFSVDEKMKLIKEQVDLGKNQTQILRHFEELYLYGFSQSTINNFMVKIRKEQKANETSFVDNTIMDVTPSTYEGDIKSVTVDNETIESTSPTVIFSQVKNVSYSLEKAKKMQKLSKELENKLVDMANMGNEIDMIYGQLNHLLNCK